MAAADEFEKSQFCTNLTKATETCLKEIQRSYIEDILCYGLGQFSDSSISLHQLAVLIVLCKKFKSTVQVFDPLFNSTEVEVLNQSGFKIIAENEEGKRVVEQNRVTLVFLPHCPKQLTNNFLWANWNKNLRNCILLCNSFSKIIESNTKRTLSESANYISEVVSYSKEIKLENSYRLPFVFNDLSIHYFSFKDFGSKVFQEPTYSKDFEFITKEIGKTLIKDV